MDEILEAKESLSIYSSIYVLHLPPHIGRALLEELQLNLN